MLLCPLQIHTSPNKTSLSMAEPYLSLEAVTLCGPPAGVTGRLAFHRHPEAVRGNIQRNNVLVLQSATLLATHLSLSVGTYLLLRFGLQSLFSHPDRRKRLSRSSARSPTPQPRRERTAVPYDLRSNWQSAWNPNLLRGKLRIKKNPL